MDDDASESRYTKASKRAADRIGHPTHPQRAHSISVDAAGPAKRRKVSGLNTRFNRMIESVNTMLSYRNSNPASSRKRIQSSGTSSVSSHDIPKTPGPVHDYDSIYPGKLGKDFSVLKTKLLPQSDSDGLPMPVALPKATRDPLPDWLAQTFYSLEVHHPLRGLLSPSLANESTGKSNSASIELLGASREEDVFAFSPFEKEDPGYRADSTFNVHAHASSVASTEPTLPHLQMEIPTTGPLPFSTPARFAPARRSTQNPVVDTSFQKRLAPEARQMTTHTNTQSTASPLSRLRRADVIGPPRIRKSSSNPVQDNGPSDLQEHGVNTNRHHQGFQSGREDMGVYVTPGPTFACSRTVYFDSPTEDPSLSDPLEPDSYQLDLGAIDFRWRPFLRSNAPESDMTKHPVSPSSPESFGYAVPDSLMLGDQSGWNARLSVDRIEHGASSEDLHCLSEDVSTAYLDNVGPIRPSNVNTTQSSAISNAIGPCQWSSPINDVQQVRVPSPQGVLLSPLRDQPEPALLAASHVPPRGDGENIHASKEFGLMYGKDMRTLVGSAVHGMRPSTPIRQTPVSPPSTPQKLRSSQLCDIPRAPVRKTYSALSWMIPLKPSKRTVVAQVDIGRRAPRVSANNRDSIESWSETS